MGDKETERQRRDQAQMNRGDVVEGSGIEIASQQLEHVVSLRLDGALLRRVRNLAGKRNVSASELMRTAIDDFVEHGSSTTRFEWTIISAEGTSPTQVRKWPETPASRSSLREVSDAARAS